MSRSLVGSSSSSTLGSVEQQPQQLEAGAARHRTGRRCGRSSRSPVKPNRSSIEVAVISPSAVFVTRRIDSTVGSTRASGVEVVEVLGQVLQRDRPPVPHPARPTGASSPRQQAEHRGLAGAVHAPPARPGRPGPSRQVACVSRVRSPRTRSTSSRSMTSLPSRWVANRCSSSRSRGGGTSSMSELAASIRNLGFEVRAGGPRRSQASSLRTRFCRRRLGGRRLALALGLRQHVGRVAALVDVDDAVVHLPGPLADRVEEPPVVGDHDQRGGRRARWSASQATASTSRWLVGSSSTTRSCSPSSSAASENGVARHRRGPARRGRRVDPGQQHLDHLARARVGGPLVVGPAGQDRLAHGVGVASSSCWAGGRSCSPRCRETRPESGASSPVITLEQRGLAVAVAAHDPDPLPGPDAEGDVGRAAGGRRTTWTPAPG